jgi:hypothetical protein
MCHDIEQGKPITKHKWRTDNPVCPFPAANVQRTDRIVWTQCKAVNVTPGSDQQIELGAEEKGSTEGHAPPSA